MAGPAAEPRRSAAFPEAVLPLFRSLAPRSYDDHANGTPAGTSIKLIFGLLVGLWPNITTIGVRADSKQTPRVPRFPSSRFFKSARGANAYGPGARPHPGLVEHFDYRRKSLAVRCTGFDSCSAKSATLSPFKSAYTMVEPDKTSTVTSFPAPVKSSTKLRCCGGPKV